MTSVASGRCGPCASMAPTGRMATAFARSRSRTSSQVNCARSSTAMGGCIVPGRAVDRQASAADHPSPWRSSRPSSSTSPITSSTPACKKGRASGRRYSPPGRRSRTERSRRWRISSAMCFARRAGQPKAVVQTHRSFANTTECYAKGVIGYTERDVTLSVPKLYFGYATGSNLLFPFSVGAATVLFPEAATADVLFQKITQFRPTILINVPTMINQMVSHPTAATRDLSCLRLTTSAGEPLPVELYHRWKDTFGVELLDGLGTAEMWHIFISNRPGLVRPGTLGPVVPGFEGKDCDAGGLTKPHAFVVANERRDGLAEELQAFVRERLEAYKYPREVTFLDALPRTHLGKVDRARLRRG